ncbi:transposase family protein [Micromonospora sp. NPDC004704]
MPDPRDPRGIRHPLVAVLAIAACAVAAGEKPSPRSPNAGRPRAWTSWQC